MDYLRIYSNGCEPPDSPGNCPKGKHDKNGKCSSAYGRVRNTPTVLKMGLSAICILFGYLFVELYIGS